jgi:phosphate transport system protein
MKDVHHIVKSYDDDLRHFDQEIHKMGLMAIAQLKDAVSSIIHHDGALAQHVIEQDAEIDRIEHNIEARAIRMIALRQPVARDLRTLITVLKVSNHLERIADYASNIAKRCSHLEGLATVPSVHLFQQMADQAALMIEDVIVAYQEGDEVKALDVWHRDQTLDDIYTLYLKELLTFMVEDPRLITAITQLLFVAKNIERIGDHTTNIAEMIYYLVKGTPFTTLRPKRAF